jgi:subtilisin family serine protease
MKQLAALALGALALTACQDVTAPVSTDSAPSFATSERIPGRFIITLRDDADASAVARAHGVSPDFVYSTVLNGFAGSMSDAARSGLLRDARVVRVEQDGIAYKTTTQLGATWGLDRIDQAALPLSKSYTYNSTGAGVTAYIIDTGIRFAHNEFGGRAVSGFDAVDGGTADDCDGHGTHVAGTVGGTTYGVAKSVKLVAVRVLNCSGSGTLSGVIAGMDWVANDVSGPSVANLSLGAAANSSVDDATRRMIAAGVATAIAAGNGNRGGRQQDACGYSPARVAEGMTIGSTTSTDTKSSWSNYGPCVDFFAPGSSITSAGHTSNTSAVLMSGTSMASPHVAGVAALYLSVNPVATPQQVRDVLFTATTKGVVTNSSTANNHLLFTAF